MFQALWQVLYVCVCVYPNLHKNFKWWVLLFQVATQRGSVTCQLHTIRKWWSWDSDWDLSGSDSSCLPVSFPLCKSSENSIHAPFAKKKQTTQIFSLTKKLKNRVGKSCCKRNDIFSPCLRIIKEIIWNVTSSQKV